MPRKIYNTVFEYLKDQPSQQRKVLLQIKKLIQTQFPDSDLVISYNIPAAKRDGKVFVYFAGFKKHISLFPPLKKPKKIINKLKKYRNEKGNLIFKIDQEIPFDLIQEVIFQLHRQ